MVLNKGCQVFILRKSALTDRDIGDLEICCSVTSQELTALSCTYCTTGILIFCSYQSKTILLKVLVRELP